MSNTLDTTTLLQDEVQLNRTNSTFYQTLQCTELPQSIEKDLNNCLKVKRSYFFDED